MNYTFFLHLLLFLLEEAQLNNNKINLLEPLHVEMYRYVLENRGIIVNPCSSCTTDQYLPAMYYDAGY